MADYTNCFVCGKRLPAARASVSHTIQPGAVLCSECGHRETVDPAWASATWLGLRRAEAAVKAAEEKS